MQVIYSMITALCLCIGFYFGFVLGRTNELPKVIKTKKERQEEEEQIKEINLLEKSLSNLNKYDGTSEGQEDII